MEVPARISIQLPVLAVEVVSVSVVVPEPPIKAFPPTLNSREGPVVATPNAAAFPVATVNPPAIVEVAVVVVAVKLGTEAAL